MELGLQGKVAIVTGSGRGIGAETARALAEEGARVVVSDIDGAVAAQTCAALQREGLQAIAVAADVTRSADVERLVQAALDAFGGVHILVNNAGFARDARIAKFSEADWDAVVDTILKGAFLCSKAVVPTMAEQQWGRIIHISSRAPGQPGAGQLLGGQGGDSGLWQCAVAGAGAQWHHCELGRAGLHRNRRRAPSAALRQDQGKRPGAHARGPRGPAARHCQHGVLSRERARGLRERRHAACDGRALRVTAD